MKTIVALAVMSPLAFTTAHAQDQQQQSFKTIVGKGYDIKGATFANSL